MVRSVVSVNQKAAIHHPSAGMSHTASSTWVSVSPSGWRTGFPRSAPSQTPWSSTPRCVADQLNLGLQRRRLSDHFHLTMVHAPLLSTSTRRVSQPGAGRTANSLCRLSSPDAGPVVDGVPHLRWPGEGLDVLRDPGDGLHIALVVVVAAVSWLLGGGDGADRVVLSAPWSPRRLGSCIKDSIPRSSSSPTDRNLTASGVYLRVKDFKPIALLRTCHKVDTAVIWCARRTSSNVWHVPAGMNPRASSLAL